MRISNIFAVTETDTIFAANDNISNYHYVKIEKNGDTMYHILDSNNILISTVSFDGSDESIIVKIFYKNLSNDFLLSSIIEKCSSLLLEYYGLQRGDNPIHKEILDYTKGELISISGLPLQDFEIQDKGGPIRFIIGPVQQSFGIETIDVRVFQESFYISKSVQIGYIPIKVGKINNKWEITSIGDMDDYFEEFVLEKQYSVVIDEVLRKINSLYPSWNQTEGQEDIPLDEPQATNTPKTILPVQSEFDLPEGKLYYKNRNIKVKTLENGYICADIFDELGEVIAEAIEKNGWWIIERAICDQETVEDILERLSNMRLSKPNKAGRSIVNTEVNCQSSLFGPGDLPLKVKPAITRGGNQLIVGRHFEEAFARLVGGEIIDQTGNFPDISTDITDLGRTFFEVKAVGKGRYFLLKMDQLNAFSIPKNIFFVFVNYKDSTPGLKRGKKRPEGAKEVDPSNLDIEDIIILPARVLREFLSECILNGTLKEKQLGLALKLDLPFQIISDFIDTQIDMVKLGKTRYTGIDLSKFHEKFEKI